MFANLDIDETETATLVILHRYNFILIVQPATNGIPWAKNNVAKAIKNQILSGHLVPKLGWARQLLGAPEGETRAPSKRRQLL